MHGPLKEVTHFRKNIQISQKILKLPPLTFKNLAEAISSEGKTPFCVKLSPVREENKKPGEFAH